MIRPARPAHLKLVSTKDADEHIDVDRRSVEQSGHQLSFPYPDSDTTYLLFLDEVDKPAFKRMATLLAPQWIFDVRTVPRLDMIASSRISAFALFEQLRASYIDVFGRLNVKSYRSVESNPAFWCETVTEILCASKRKGPYFFLFDDLPLLEISSKVLASALSASQGGFARVVRGA
ncbi:MAG TPA: hypothetical protein VGN07_20780 [Steroidobacteraceae bacterium]|jgi:hypothetical protein